MVRTLRTCALILALAAVPGPAGCQNSQAAEAQARDFLTRLRAATQTPAVSAAVLRHDSLVFSAGVGFIDLDNLVAATGTSVYNVGSVSKVITGVAIMQLVDRGTISLSDDVRRYVPEFPDKGVTITLRHILTHTSGIRHYHDADFAGTADGENMLPVTSFLDGLPEFANDSLLFAPGAFYFYSSYAVNLLEGVIERVTGMPFEQYLREHVWDPAGMTSAQFDVPERVVRQRARSYRIVDGDARNASYGDVRYKFASGGMIGSVEDLVRFAGALNRGVLVTGPTRDRMFSEQIAGLETFVEGGAPRTRDQGQGLLWRLRRDRQGRRVAYHCGSVKAFNVCLVDYYDEDLVAAIATNAWDCCGWSKADSLAAFFRVDGRGSREGR